MLKRDLGDKLLHSRPTALLLLTVIAFRARRTEQKTFDGLEIGEALIGDYEKYGVSRQIYRDDLAFLEKNQLITTKRTTKGTIAKLLSDEVFDINAEGRRTIERTKREPSENQQRTTNNNVIKKEKINKATPISFPAEIEPVLTPEQKEKNRKAIMELTRGLVRKVKK